jgi:ABC-2 type transport system permease protein
MAGNSDLIPAKNEGGLQGYRNLSRNELASWWRTGTWWRQALIWVAIIDGMLAMVLMVVPQIEAKEKSAAVQADQNFGLMMFFTMLGMAPAVGAVIIGMEGILDEKLKGTAGWLLSKPVSRTAFIVSKFAPNALGILVSMMLIPMLVGVGLFALAGEPVDILRFTGGTLLGYLQILFYLALAIMLSTLSNARGLVIGLPMGLIFGYQLFLGIAPGTGDGTGVGKNGIELHAGALHVHLHCYFHLCIYPAVRERGIVST